MHLGEYERAISHYEQAIVIARQIGDRRNEGIHLGNLGDALSKIGKWEDAEQHLSSAAAICKETFPPAAGAFCGFLAWLCAQRQQTEKALRWLQEGEPLVAVYPLEHGKFLCNKARVLHLAGQPEAAREALQQAQSIAAELKSKEDSGLAKMITEINTVIGEAP